MTQKLKKLRKGNFTLLANKYWVLEILMSSEQNVGTYNAINIINTNYTKIHIRFFNDLFDEISLANVGMPVCYEIGYSRILF